MSVNVARHSIVGSVTDPNGNDFARNAALLTTRNERMTQLVQVVGGAEVFKRPIASLNSFFEIPFRYRSSIGVTGIFLSV